jgi:hypothetical protein
MYVYMYVLCVRARTCVRMYEICMHASIVYVRMPFGKFVDSPYYSESEICGGAVTVSFQSTSLGKRCTSCNAPPTSRKRATDGWSLRNFLPRSSLFMVKDAQKPHGVRSGLYDGSTFSKPNTEFNSDLSACDFWAFPTMKREIRGKKFRSDHRFAARFREMGGAL